MTTSSLRWLQRWSLAAGETATAHLTRASWQVMIPRLQLPCYFYRLRTLMLDYNKIGDKGAVALS